MVLHSGRGLYFHEAELVPGNPLQYVNPNKHAVKLKCAFEDRGHTRITNQLSGYPQRFIEALTISIYEDAPGKGFSRQLTNLLPMGHDGTNSVGGICGELGLVHEKVKALWALDTGDESGL
jgi:hypothetical protein